MTTNIFNIIQEEDYNQLTFTDAFAGTGVVSQHFQQAGFQIIANDIQYYSYLLNYAQLCQQNICLDNLPNLNNCNRVDGFIYQNYCAGSGSERNYFTDYNGQKCDGIRLTIENLYQTNQINIDTYYYLLASLINSIDKYANTTSVYGAFLKKIKNSAKKDFKLELLPIINGRKNGITYNKDINSLINEIKGDVLYLDPPYNARQYCSNYHVLETIAKYDNPILRGKTGLRDNTHQKSAFCSKRTVYDAFEELINNANFKYIFLSYNNEGLMDLDTIKSIMSKYGEYKVVTTEYRRFRADKKENRNHKASSTIEYLHCLIKG